MAEGQGQSQASSCLATSVVSSNNKCRVKHNSMFSSVLSAYGLKEEEVVVEPFGTGLINRTWKVRSPHNDYILQKVNQAVFKQPENIAHNCRVLAGHLKQHNPEYLFVEPVRTLEGEEMVFCQDEGYYRLFPFVPGSHSIDVVETPEQAYEAARQFGRFTRLLSGVDVANLKITIPSFHDLSLRYRQFLEALEKGNSKRKEEAIEEAEALLGHQELVAQFEAIKTNPAFKLRVTHHDTKISNVLFDEHDRGLCVIDLDTVMPGYFISDVGDMMRTYLSPVSEEEKDLSRIMVREEFYKAIVEGYSAEMKDELSEQEKQCFLFAGKFMIYMQALRFFTDHLNNDVYYGAVYEGQNLVRAKNQLALLQQLVQKQDVLENSIVL